MPWKFSPNIIASPSLEGEAVSLSQVLEAREYRAIKQDEMLKHGKPLISLTLTAMGAVKRSPLLDAIFNKAKARIEEALSLPLYVSESYNQQDISGHFALWMLEGNADAIKRKMIAVEKSSPLARLWDIDVIDLNGKPLSRVHFDERSRQCLLCSQSAKICARERTHAIVDLQANMQRRFQLDEIAENIGEHMRIAIKEEASLTPKAGLVDKVSNGGHADMNWQLFIDSADAIAPYLTACVKMGMTFANQKPSAILPAIRPIGLCAEQAMLQATSGVNTHKGMIFAFGIFASALGKAIASHDIHRYNDNDDYSISLSAVLAIVSDMCANLPDELLHASPSKHSEQKTAGQRIFDAHGLLGARGEVASGFRTVLDFSLPVYVREWERDSNHQRAVLVTLISLYAYNDDTTTVNRVGIEGLRAHQQWAKTQLSNEELISNESRLIQSLQQYDEECSKKKLSAGGSADLLALTLFINRLFSYYSHTKN